MVDHHPWHDELRAQMQGWGVRETRRRLVNGGSWPRGRNGFVENWLQEQGEDAAAADATVEGWFRRHELIAAYGGLLISVLALGVAIAAYRQDGQQKIEPPLAPTLEKKAK